MLQNLPIRGYQNEPVPNQFLRQEGEAHRLAILLPGLGYSCDMPLFYYAQNLLEESGVDVLRVEYDYRHLNGPDGFSIEEHGPRLSVDSISALRVGLEQRKYREVILVGKSLGTLAMGHMAEVELLHGTATKNVWLTPVLRDDKLRHQMSTSRDKSLVVIGTVDPHYDPVLLDQLQDANGARIVVIEGADHGLDVPGDVSASIDAIAHVARVLKQFLHAEPRDIYRRAV